MQPLEAAQELNAVIAASEPKFLALTDEHASQPPAPGKWSPKEILGHLIDSAANNHQRFIRLQQLPELALPGYEQNFWVAANGYADRPWKELVVLWGAYNRHLAHVIGRIPAESLGHVWVNGSARYELGFLAADYVQHLRHHVDQILGND